MGDEDCEIKGAGPVVVRVGHGTNVVVVEDIRTKKQRRRGQRGQHRKFVALALAAADGDIADDEKERAEGVEPGVDIR